MTNTASAPAASFVFGSKAETLQRLQTALRTAHIPRLRYFSRQQWQSSAQNLVADVCADFPNALVAVRSSAIDEDGHTASMAGAYLSKLNINTAQSATLQAAIHAVFASMPGDAEDQVLIQLMLSDIAVSGVIMTYDVVHGAPYYCIDYDDESGRSDIVTGGNGLNKGLFVYRDAPAHMLRSPRIASMLTMARELETLCDCPALDIEFGMNRQGELFLLQVRRIALANRWHPNTERRIKRQLAFVESFVAERSSPHHGVLGQRSILAMMPDWNPAEIIGSTPRPLAASLYRELITQGVWTKARSLMGYRAVGDAELMLLINQHPYIDVRNSFNSFLPAALPDPIGEALVNAWLDRLQAQPELHDKVEFDIVPTCLDFCFDEDFSVRYPSVLQAGALAQYRHSLLQLTRNCLAPEQNSSLQNALNEAAILDGLHYENIPRHLTHPHLARAAQLIQQCRRHGTLPFAIVARHAFIAEALLRSAVRKGALTEERLQAFKRSIHTITRDMVEHFDAVSSGHSKAQAFLQKFGHLRPGTYEITSLRYDERSDLFSHTQPATPTQYQSSFELSAAERTALQALLQTSQLDVVDADGLLHYARQAIAGREQVKFSFTRALSDALLSLGHWGAAQGLGREDLSYLEWSTLSRSLIEPLMDEGDRHFLKLAEAARQGVEQAYTFRLSHILCDVRDIYVATLNRSTPNFIGQGRASGNVLVLSAQSAANASIEGKIVCIENADPGFDWIFARRPQALITQFGGANSHMAIRCAELNLAAAIGCGEQIYARIISAGQIELNCAEKILRPINEHTP